MKQIIRKNRDHKKLFIALATIVILFATVGVMAAVQNVGPFADNNVSQIESQGTDTSELENENPTNSNQEDVTDDDSVKQSAPTKTTSPSSGTTPATPSGTFVSDHSTESIDKESLCNTTPGVTCYITFTKGGTVKQLPAMKTNSAGIAIWNWNVNNIGLTSGNWKITMIAKNGDKTASSSDLIPLEVN